MSIGAPHVVLGAGQVGAKVAQLLVAEGHHVILCRQSAAPSPVPGIVARRLDAHNAQAVAQVTKGAAVVYHCASPAYHLWHRDLLPLTRGIANGIRHSRAPLVVLDNLYMYGETAHIDEASVTSPVSRKGRLRAEAAAILLDVGATIGRAADFFGPETPISTLGEDFWRRILAGKSAQLFGDPDQPHSYSFTPDVARSLVALGSHPARGESAGTVWMLPTLPAQSTRTLVERFAAALGRTIRIGVVPTAVLRAMGLFSPTIRELAEMTYQWKQPFVVNSDKFQHNFGIAPTPWESAVAQTTAWAKKLVRA